VARPAPARVRRRSECPIAGALEVLGDRWTLLVLRDALFVGKRLFQEFLESPEGIPTATLAERLRRLEKSGVLRRVAYRNRPVRFLYEPTARGRELRRLLHEAARWGLRHVGGTRKPTAAQLRAFARGLARERDAGGRRESATGNP